MVLAGMSDIPDDHTSMDRWFLDDDGICHRRYHRGDITVDWIIDPLTAAPTRTTLYHADTVLLRLYLGDYTSTDAGVLPMVIDMACPGSAMRMMLELDGVTIDTRDRTDWFTPGRLYRTLDYPEIADPKGDIPLANRRYAMTAIYHPARHA